MAGYDGAGAVFALGVRLTKLDTTGAPLTGTANSYTTSALVSISVGQTYSSPDSIELKNGSGATCVFYQPSAVLLGGTISDFKFCTPDPNVLAFCAGGDVITTGGTNEQQTVTISGTPTGGTFTLTFNGQTTTAIAYNAISSVVLSALIALSNIRTGDVTVTGGPGPGTPYVVTFAGQFASEDGASIPQMTATGSLHRRHHPHYCGHHEHGGCRRHHRHRLPGTGGERQRHPQRGRDRGVAAGHPKQRHRRKPALPALGDAPRETGPRRQLRPVRNRLHRAEFLGDNRAQTPTSAPAAPAISCSQQTEYSSIAVRQVFPTWMPVLGQ
jgi:hypothetical protein